MDCPFCFNESKIYSKLPVNRFNNKSFTYYSCKSCDLLFINPVPSQEDLILMYPPSYQQGVSKQIDKLDLKQPGLRHSYGTLLSVLKSRTNANSIIDFGCGNGKFVWNAYKNGLNIEGVEYFSEQVSNLSREIPEVNFYTVKEFMESDNKYDIIFMSNVLEHFTNPKAELEQLMTKLNENGLLLVEGPLEKNTSFVNYCKWKYFQIRKLASSTYQTSFAPVHIFYSNYKNQLSLFESLGLNTSEYYVTENAWPYPSRVSEVKSVGDVIKYLISLISRGIGVFSSKYGNTFIYVGEKKGNK